MVPLMVKVPLYLHFQFRIHIFIIIVTAFNQVKESFEIITVVEVLKKVANVLVNLVIVALDLSEQKHSAKQKQYEAKPLFVAHRV